LDKKVYTKALEHLNGDVLKNLSTLKYLTLYREYAGVYLIEDDWDWAVLSTFPTAILSYDTATYPDARQALFLNGSSKTLKHQLLTSLKPDHYILRLNEDLDLSPYREKFKITPGHAYISFTSLSSGILSNHALIAPKSQMTGEAVSFFARNGYTPDDLEKYFHQGAQWFGQSINGKLVSACFVFPNYDGIWEIAGVHTLEEARRHGYAETVVYSALAYLTARGLTPRYEAEQKNLASIYLAGRLKMKEFLTIRHFLFTPV
jgi:GNAT superfamily N-acetyltransferase